MAFSVKQIKKILSDNGMPVDNLEQAASDICGRHAADMDALKEERDSFKADAEKYEAARSELEGLKAKADDGYKARYEKERDDFKKYREGVEKEKADAVKKAEYTNILKDAGIASSKIEKVLKYTDLNKLELDEDGKLTDRKTLLKEVKAEWPEYIEKQVEKGAETATPPATNGGQTGANGRAAQIWAERQKRLYGIEGNENK